MRIGLYSPYVPKHFGGGEKHFFDVALALSKKHEVFVGIPSNSNQLSDKTSNYIRENYSKFLNRSLKRIHFLACPFGTDAFFFNKLFWTGQFDAFYTVTDGSLFFSLAKQNYLHIQIPFTDSKKSLMDRMKLSIWRHKNTNSYFTKQIIEQSWNVTIDSVLQPMVSVEPLLIKPSDLPLKQNIILHVGRFFSQLHCKRQDTLVQIFRDLLKKRPELSETWKLVLIGSVEDHQFAKKVEKSAKGLPIEIIHNVDRDDLNSWYKKASIYWHATGYGTNPVTQPEKSEHFGISTVEAMAAGCAPVVINLGGQTEILVGELTQYLWNTTAECVDTTLQLIDDPAKMILVQLMAQQRAKQFNQARFDQQVLDMVE